MSAPGLQPRVERCVQPRFDSPASTTLDELVALAAASAALRRRERRPRRAPLAGAGLSRRLGRGLDFAETREYQSGDDVRLIDWRVTARSGRVHTKLFVEERERPVLFVIDARVTMRFGTRGMFKSALAARLAGLLGWSAVSARERVGGFVLSDDWHAEVRPRGGRGGLMALFRAIVQSQHRTPSGARGQLGDTLARLRQVVPPGATVVLLSDFHDFDERARAALGALLHGHDLVAVQLFDPLERELPRSGRYEVASTVTEDAAGRQSGRAPEGRPPGGHGEALGRLVLHVGGWAQRRAHAARFAAHWRSVDAFFVRGAHPHIGLSTAEPLLDAAARVLGRVAGLPP